MEIADKIKKIRTDNKLSQEKFANDLFISRQSVIAYEKGKTIPHTDVLIQICKTFNVDLSYFIEDGKADFQTFNVNEKDKAKKEIIAKRIVFNDKLYKAEKKKDLIDLDIQPFSFLQIAVWFMILPVLHLYRFVDYIFTLAMPVIIVVGIIVNKKVKIDYIINYYIKKRNSIYNKKGHSLSPQYPIYLNIKDNDIYIFYRDELIFYCPFEEYDHYVVINENYYQASMLNVEPGARDFSYSLAFYLKGNGVPYIISFPLYYKNKKENINLYHINKINYTICLNECCMQLKTIKKLS